MADKGLTFKNRCHMLRNLKELKARVANFSLDRNDFNYQERLIDEREDYLRVAFVTNPLPPIDDSVSFRKNYRQYTSYSLVIVVKSDSFFMGKYEKTYVRVGNRIFPKERCVRFIYVDSHKVNLRDFPGCTILSGMPNIFLSLFGLETFKKDAKSDTIVDSVLRNKLVIGGIVKGNITNWADAWKKYCKTSLKINSDYRLVEEYFATCRVSVSDLIDLTTNWRQSMRILIKTTPSYEGGIYDGLLEDAFLLNKKINLGWSKKRCLQEHQRNIEEIMLKSDNSKLSDEPIHSELVEKDTFSYGENTFKILNSEKDIFKEATFMHNCIHSHYFPRIDRGEYFVFVTEINKGEKVDIGYRWDWTNEKFQFEQMHTIYNGSVPVKIAEKLREAVESYQENLIRLRKFRCQYLDSFKAQKDAPDDDELPY